MWWESATTGLQALQGFILRLQASIVSIRGPPRLCFEPLSFWIVTFMRIRIQFFTPLRIRIHLLKIMRIRIRNPYSLVRVPIKGNFEIHMQLWHLDSNPNPASQRMRILPTRIFDITFNSRFAPLRQFFYFIFSFPFLSNVCTSGMFCVRKIIIRW